MDVLVLLVVLVAVVGAAVGVLVWWTSGRSRPSEHNPLAAGERGEAEARTMRQYRPNGNAPLGPFG